MAPTVVFITGVDHIDYAVANAGIAKAFLLIKDAKRTDVLEHIELIVLSDISFYQSTRRILKKSVTKPVYAVMGSGAGALACQLSNSNTAYGACRTVLSWSDCMVDAFTNGNKEQYGGKVVFYTGKFQEH
ncbi:hypothetical protein PENANT_c037G00507 [Penicillium antarcticum]|uniref:Uncharacterized protein n=1 Tax=Penicillium antarcticum TaxID=416450 RepID=A0A1V6PUW4_9EURO|nr:hypothetical protein PENANT_c037G00507 [Penicillium antarcticum]